MGNIPTDSDLAVHTELIKVHTLAATKTHNDQSSTQLELHELNDLADKDQAKRSFETKWDETQLSLQRFRLVMSKT